MGFLYLFRHAESKDNRQHLFSGWRDVDLSTKGEIEAQELSELLKNKRIDLFYSPDLQRNLRTVEAIRNHHPQAQIVIDDRLKERSYGELQGRPHLDLMRENLELYLKYHRSYDFPPPGGESIQMVESRVKPFHDELLFKLQSQEKSLAVCAGNNAMRVLRRYLENLSIEQMMKLENPYDNYFEYGFEARS